MARIVTPMAKKSCELCGLNQTVGHWATALQPALLLAAYNYPSTKLDIKQTHIINIDTAIQPFDMFDPDPCPTNTNHSHCPYITVRANIIITHNMSPFLLHPTANVQPIMMAIAHQHLQNRRKRKVNAG